jgi:5-methylcytosine-specific restriction endonuclease McrA
MMSWIWTPKYNNNTDNNTDNTNDENNDITDNYTANPVRNRRITLNNVMKETIWIRTYGEVFRTKCYVCNRNTITPFSSVIAHKISLANGGSNDLSNLIHICSPCNSSMRTNDLETFKEKINNV